MPESVGSLTRQQRHQLLDIFDQIPNFDKQQGRDMLLNDLPAKLIDSMQRSATKALDLNEIVMKTLQWGALEDGTPAIFYVIENAIHPSRGSAVGQALHNFYQELTNRPPAPVTGVPDTPPETQEMGTGDTDPALEAQSNADWANDLLKSLEAGDFAKADEIFTRVEQETPEADKLNFRAFYYYLLYTSGKTSALGSLQELAQQLDQEAEAEPDTVAQSGTVQAYIGACYEAAGAYERAIAAYELASTLGPDEDVKATRVVSAAKGFYLAGEKHRGYTKIMQALTAFSTASAQSILYQGLATLYQRDEKDELRAITLEKAIELDPNNLDLHFDAGYAYGQEHFTALPVLHYDLLLRFKAAHAYALNNLAVAYRELKMPIAAVSNFKKSAAAGNSLASANLAGQYLDAGFAEEAQRVVDAAKQQPDMHRNLGEMIAAIALHQKTEEDVKKTALIAAREQQWFLRIFAEAYFSYAADVQQLTGTWRLYKDEPEKVVAEVTITQSGDEVIATWTEGSTEYKMTAVLHNRGAIITGYHIESLFRPSVGDRGYIYLYLEDQKLGAMIFKAGEHSFLTFIRDIKEAAPDVPISPS